MTPLVHVSSRYRVQYVPIPKCASTTMLAALYGLDGTVEEMHERKPPLVPWDPEGYPAIVIVRHPAARLASVWANKVHRPHRPDTVLLARHGFVQGMSFPAFVARVLRVGVRNLDQHIRPQVDFLPPGATLLRLETLAEDAAAAGLDWLLPWTATAHNVSEGDRAPWNEYLSAMVADAYEEDVRLWTWPFKS